MELKIYEYSNAVTIELSDDERELTLTVPHASHWPTEAEKANWTPRMVDCMHELQTAWFRIKRLWDDDIIRAVYQKRTKRGVVISTEYERKCK